MSRILKRLILVFSLVSMTSGYCFALNEKYPQRVIIFISFSMPKESIKGWMNEAAKINAPVIIRGLINNSFKETVKSMNELMSDNKGGIQLDPTLFKEFNVKRVPAVIIKNETDYNIAYGDVHLDYALQQFIKINDSLSGIAQAYLDQLRGVNHA